MCNLFAHAESFNKTQPRTCRQRNIVLMLQIHIIANQTGENSEAFKDNMNTNKLVALLHQALQKGFEQPDIPELARGTYYERWVAWHVKTDSDLESAFINYFSSTPEFEIFDEKLINLGGGAIRVSYSTLIGWLLLRASEIGPEKTVEHLQKYLSLDHTPATQILAIRGVMPKEKIALSNHIYLVPFKDLPSSFGKLAVDLLRGLPPGRLTPRDTSPHAALIRRVKLSPKFVEPGAHLSPMDSHKLQQVCDLLTLIGRCSPVSAGQWHNFDDWVPLQGMVDVGCSGSNIYDILHFDAYEFSDGEVSDFRKLYRKFTTLKPSVSDLLRIPLQRLNQARRRSNLVDKAIDLSIAFESLLLSSKVDTELSFTFRLRGAWLLAEESEQRSDILEILKKFYKLRSRAVHSGKLSDTINVKDKRLSPGQFLKKVDELCAKAIKSIICEGDFPNWENLVLGLP